MAGTKSVLDIQSDLTQPNAPAALTDVANKDYVDTSVAAAAVPDATSAPGGSGKGKLTMDEDLGLVIAAGIAGVKLDSTKGVEFSGSGAVQAKLSAVPAEQGLEFSGGGHLKAKVDGSTIGLDGSGNISALAGVVPNATSGTGDTGTLGKMRANSDEGVELNGVGTLSVKLNPATMQFDGSGRLDAIGGGGGGPATGPISRRAQFTRDISAVTPPTPVVLGTQIDALSHPDASTTGQRFELQVPQDYHSGDITMNLVYSMSTGVASPNNEVTIETFYEVIEVATGLITPGPTASGPFTTPDGTTDFLRQLVLTIPAAAFGPGDTIEIFVKRLGADGADLHTGALQIVAYDWSYTGIIDSRVSTQQVDFLSNAPPEAAPTPGTIGTQTDVLSFLTGVDNSQKFSFIVPDNWDGQSDAVIYLTYAMSSSAASVVRLETTGEVADVVGGSINAIGLVNNDLGTSADTSVHRVVLRSLPASGFNVGDSVSIKLVRRGLAGADTHAGNFRLIDVAVVFLVAPASGFSTITVEEHYLEMRNFDVVAGTPSGDIEYPAFGTTFDSLVAMVNGGGGAEQIDCAFAGRLMSAQSQLAQLKINVLGIGGTPQYKLLVYTDGPGAGTPAYDSGLVAAPGTLTEVVVLAGSLSKQPLLQKRFHVVVEAHVDAGEEVKVSHPFVRQE